MREEWKGLGSYGTVGIELVLSILLGFLAGQWLDKRFGAHGWLSLIGFGLGVAAGFRSLYEAAQKARRQAEAEDERERRKRRGDTSDDERDTS